MEYTATVKKILLTLIAMACGLMAFASTPQDNAVGLANLTLHTQDFKKFTLVYPIKVGTIKNFHLGKLSLGSPDAVVLPGLTVASKPQFNVNGGVLWKFNAGDNLSLVAGPTVWLQHQEKPRIGLLIGFNYAL